MRKTRRVIISKTKRDVPSPFIYNNIIADGLMEVEQEATERAAEVLTLFGPGFFYCLKEGTL